MASPVTSSETALTIPQIQEAMRRGLVKAAAEHLVAYRDGSDFLVPSSADPTTEYRVVKTGHQWFSWQCACQAGQHGRICKHVALAVFATKHHVHAKRPQMPVSTAFDGTRHACATCGDMHDGASAYCVPCGNARASLVQIEERRQQRTAVQQRDSAWWADAQARVAAANARSQEIFEGQF